MVMLWYLDVYYGQRNTNVLYSITFLLDSGGGSPLFKTYPGAHKF